MKFALSLLKLEIIHVKQRTKKKVCTVRGSSHKYGSGICSWEQDVHRGTKSQVTCIMKHFLLGQSYTADSLKYKVLHSDFNFQMKSSEKWAVVAEIAWSPVLSSILLSPPKFLTKSSYGKSNEKISRIQAENLEMQQIIYLNKVEYPWEIWKDHQIIKVIHDWKTISDCVN